MLHLQTENSKRGICMPSDGGYAIYLIRGMPYTHHHFLCLVGCTSAVDNRSDDAVYAGTLEDSTYAQLQHRLHDTGVRDNPWQH